MTAKPSMLAVVSGLPGMLSAVQTIQDYAKACYAVIGDPQRRLTRIRFTSKGYIRLPKRLCCRSHYVGECA